MVSGGGGGDHSKKFSIFCFSSVVKLVFEMEVVFLSSTTDFWAWAFNNCCLILFAFSTRFEESFAFFSVCSSNNSVELFSCNEGAILNIGTALAYGNGYACLTYVQRITLIAPVFFTIFLKMAALVSSVRKGLFSCGILPSLRTVSTSIKCIGKVNLFFLWRKPMQTLWPLLNN